MKVPVRTPEGETLGYLDLSVARVSMTETEAALEYRVLRRPSVAWIGDQAEYERSVEFERVLFLASFMKFGDVEFPFFEYNGNPELLHYVPGFKFPKSLEALLWRMEDGGEITIRRQQDVWHVAWSGEGYDEIKDPNHGEAVRDSLLRILYG